MGYQEIGDIGQLVSAGFGVSARNLQSGEVTAEQVVMAGGTKGAIRSQNFVSGTSGWAAFGDGSAEFANASVIGSIQIGNADDGIFLTSSLNQFFLLNLDYMNTVIEFQHDFFNTDIVGNPAIGTTDESLTSGWPASLWLFGPQEGLTQQGLAAPYIRLSAPFAAGTAHAISMNSPGEFTIAANSAKEITTTTAVPFYILVEEHDGFGSGYLGINAEGQVIVGDLAFSAGSATLPHLAQRNDWDTGLYWGNDNTLGISAGGSEMMMVTTSGVEFGGGATGDAFISSGGDFSWVGDTDTYMDRSGADIIRWVTGGSERMRASSAGVQIGGISTGDALIDTTGNYSWTGDTDTYMDRPAADALRFVTGGVERVRVDSGGIDMFGHHIDMGGGNLYYSGTSNPSIRFESSYVGINNGSWNMVAYSTRNEFRVVTHQESGIRWYGDTDTGIDEGAGNQISMVCGNAERGLWGTSGLHVGANNSGDLYIADDFISVGNHETLRADRLGGGSLGTSQVGYYSSWIKDPATGKTKKYRIKPVAEAGEQYWKREWFLDIEPIKYERIKESNTRPGRSDDNKKEAQTKRGKEYRPIELGFSIENLIKHTNMLTTKGNLVGGTPDEYALLSVTIDYVQHLEERVRALEDKVAALT